MLRLQNASREPPLASCCTGVHWEVSLEGPQGLINSNFPLETAGDALQQPCCDRAQCTSRLPWIFVLKGPGLYCAER